GGWAADVEALHPLALAVDGRHCGLPRRRRVSGAVLGPGVALPERHRHRRPALGVDEHVAAVEAVHRGDLLGGVDERLDRFVTAIRRHFVACHSCLHRLEPNELNFGLVGTPRKGDNRKPSATESLDMTAAETQLHLDTELDRIEQWRAEELERAGYPVREAARLAERHDVDLHLAIDLISQGCPVPVAVEILL